MAKAKLFAKDGKAKGEMDLPGSHFDQAISEPSMHLAVEIYLGNQRQGTHKTKGRSEVSGTTQKPWKQKGTGRARAGSNTSPIWVRGGKAHGAQPRSYRKSLNKKMRQRALLSALTVKAKESAVSVFESIELSQPKTKELFSIFKQAELTGTKTLLILGDSPRELSLAARNIPNLIIGRVSDLNTYQVLNCKNLIFTKESVEKLVKSNEAQDSAEQEQAVSTGESA